MRASPGRGSRRRAGAVGALCAGGGAGGGGGDGSGAGLRSTAMRAGPWRTGARGAGGRGLDGGAAPSSSCIAASTGSKPGARGADGCPCSSEAEPGASSPRIPVHPSSCRRVAIPWREPSTASVLATRPGAARARRLVRARAAGRLLSDSGRVHPPCALQAVLVGRGPLARAGAGHPPGGLARGSAGCAALGGGASGGSAAPDRAALAPRSAQGQAAPGTPEAAGARARAQAGEAGARGPGGGPGRGRHWVTAPFGLMRNTL